MNVIVTVKILSRCNSLVGHQFVGFFSIESTERVHQHLPRLNVCICIVLDMNSQCIVEATGTEIIDNGNQHWNSVIFAIPA